MYNKDLFHGEYFNEAEFRELEAEAKDYDMWEIAWKNKYLKVTENLRTFQDDRVLREVLIDSANVVIELNGNPYAFLSKNDELLIVPTSKPLLMDEEIYVIMKDNVMFLFSYAEEYNVFQYEGILFIEKIDSWNKDKFVGHYKILYSQLQTEQFEIFFGLSLEELQEKVIEWEEQLVNIPKKYNYGNLVEILKELAGTLALNNLN